jgi:hypothetical protein
MSDTRVPSSIESTGPDRSHRRSTDVEDNRRLVLRTIIGTSDIVIGATAIPERWDQASVRPLTISPGLAPSMLPTMSSPRPPRT